MSSPTPQFSTADFGTGQRCGICGGPIETRSYVVNSTLACAKCAAAGGAIVSTDSHAAFVQSVLYGIGAAVLGLAIYATFTIVTHFYFGYVALLVGWLVGKAMMMGSKGVGGPRYQIAAVLLTYAAISLASVPILIAAAMREGNAVDWASMMGRLVIYGIASPFLELGSGMGFGLIGLFILFIGLRIAYRMTAAKRMVAVPRVS
ncbi:MAG TPA: hypothetical protein VK716_02910 [Terracidiphilus sp.]|nr:hypothetical protein [Terracidiphilus sp.]